MELKKDNISLERMRDAFIKVLDEHIEANNFQKVINEIPNLNMGEIISLYESISEKLLETNDGRSIIRRYVNTIKENKDLKNVFSLYNYIKTTNINENHELSLNEAISCIGYVDNNNYKKGLKTLAKIVSEGLVKTNVTRTEINAIIENTNKIYNDIDFIVLNKKTLKNVNEHVLHKDNIINFLKENKVKAVESKPETVLSNKDIINDINEIIGSVNESWVKELIENLTVNNISQLSSQPLFESYKNDCMELINTIIENDDDIKNKSHMLSMKEGLEKKVYNVETFYTDIINLAELKTTLNESAYEN